MAAVGELDDQAAGDHRTRRRACSSSQAWVGPSSGSACSAEAMLKPVVNISGTTQVGAGGALQQGGECRRLAWASCQARED